MKPIIILPPDTMSEENIKALRDNDLCVVVAKDPARVKFLDPIPATAARTKVDDAAIQLSRKLLNRGFWNNDSTRQTVAATYVDILIQGTRLDPNGSTEEQYLQIFDSAKRQEIERLAREEARVERAAKRAAAKKPEGAK